MIASICVSVLFAGCGATECEPVERPPTHKWFWHPHSTDIEPASQDLAAHGWDIWGWSHPRTLFKASKSVGDVQFTVIVFTFDNVVSAELTGTRWIQRAEDAPAALAPVKSELDERFNRAFGMPSSTDYESGFHCSEI